MPGGNHRAGLFLDFFDITKSRSGKSFGSRAESPKHDSPRAAPWVKVIRMICRPEGAFQAAHFLDWPFRASVFGMIKPRALPVGYDEVALSAQANARQGWFKILNVKARLNKYHA
jgi:hypothetical protein